MMLSHILLFLFYSSVPLRDLHSFPTRRSSDLVLRESYRRVRARCRSARSGFTLDGRAARVCDREHELLRHGRGKDLRVKLDRKSTRLNSSHVEISYAVFCLKKKKNNINIKRNT